MFRYHFAWIRCIKSCGSLQMALLLELGKFYCSRISLTEHSNFFNNLIWACIIHVNSHPVMFIFCSDFNNQFPRCNIDWGTLKGFMMPITYVECIFQCNTLISLHWIVALGKGKKTIAPPSDAHHLSFPQVSSSKVEWLRSNRALNMHKFTIELNGKTVQKGFACLTLEHMAKSRAKRVVSWPLQLLDGTPGLDM